MAITYHSGTFHSHHTQKQFFHFRLKSWPFWLMAIECGVTGRGEQLRVGRDVFCGVVENVVLVSMSVSSMVLFSMTNEIMTNYNFFIQSHTWFLLVFNADNTVEYRF